MDDRSLGIAVGYRLKVKYLGAAARLSEMGKAASFVRDYVNVIVVSTFFVSNNANAGLVCDGFHGLLNSCSYICSDRVVNFDWHFTVRPNS